MNKIIVGLNPSYQLHAKCYSEGADYPVKTYASIELARLFKSLANKTVKNVKFVSGYLVVKYNDIELMIDDYRKFMKYDLFAPINEQVEAYTEQQELNRYSSVPKANRKSAKGKAVFLGAIASFIAFTTIAVALNDEPITVDPNVGVTHSQIQVIDGDEIGYTKDGPKIFDESNIIRVSFEDRSYYDKAESVEARYGDTIKEYACRYGLDENVVKAMAIQERGSHSSTIDDGGGVGIMQIQYDVWVNENVKAYNFETGEYETLKITDDNVRDLETNIKIGCMIFQNNLVSMDYNLVAALQAYNCGTGKTKKRLNEYASEHDKTYESVIQNVYDTKWLNKFGEYAYTPLVLSYVSPEDYNITLRNIETGEYIYYDIDNPEVNNSVTLS